MGLYLAILRKMSELQDKKSQLPETTGDYPGGTENHHQCPPSSNTWILKSHRLRRAGQLPVKPTTKMETTLLDTARDWKMQVDLDQKLSFPPEIITTNLRPDLILWSTSQKSLFIVELTVPWEAAIGEADERKRLKYSDLLAEAVQTVAPCRGWVQRFCNHGNNQATEGVGRPYDKPLGRFQRLLNKAATGCG